MMCLCPGRSPKPSARWRYGSFIAFAGPQDLLTRYRAPLLTE
jgi:hypothetical protein